MTEQATIVDAVADTRERVQQAMAEFVGEHAVTELPSGDVAVRYGSAQVAVTLNIAGHSVSRRSAVTSVSANVSVQVNCLAATSC